MESAASDATGDPLYGAGDDAPPPALPHPELPAGDGAAAPGELLPVRGSSRDPLWDFHLSLPGAALTQLSSGAPRPAGARLHLLAVYRGREVPFEAEILGGWLDREIDPEVRLRQWLRGGAHHDVVSFRSIPLRSGRAGDALARYPLGRRALVRRVLARKWGPRLFLALIQAPEDAYPALAGRFAGALGSLGVDHDNLGPYAEPVEPVQGGGARALADGDPGSWTVLEPPSARGGAGFLASPREAQVAGTPAVDCRVLPRGDAKSAQEAAAKALAAAGEDLGPRGLDRAPIGKPLLSWRGAWMGLYKGRCRVVCRVVWHNSAWVVVTGIGREGRDEDGAALAWRGADLIADAVQVEG